jgi:hypothetical protein
MGPIKQKTHVDIKNQLLSFKGIERATYEGRDYLLCKFQKEYSFGACCWKLLKNIFTGQIFTDKAIERWSKILKGTAIKHYEVPDVCKLLSMKDDIAFSYRSEEEIIEFQGTLEERHIGLNCLNPPRLTRPNRIQPEVIQDFFKDYEDTEEIQLEKKLFDNLDCITYEELQRGLDFCCKELNTLLDNQPYAVGFLPEKSGEWVAELALPRMNLPPQFSFYHVTDTAGWSAVPKKDISDDRVDHFVIFDDGAYTGKQLSKIIADMDEKLKDRPRPCHLYIVVLFSSSHADKKLSAKAFKSTHIYTHILTTDRRIKAMTDCFSIPEIDKLTEIADDTTMYRNAGRRYKCNKCLSFMEWKVPDYTSMPHTVKWRKISKNETLKFITSFPPPYKHS